MLRSKLIYIIVLVMSLAYAILYNEHSTMVYFLMVCILPAVLLSIILPLSFFLKVQSMPCKTVINKGEELEIPFIISNSSVLPVSEIGIKMIYYNEFDKKKYTTIQAISLGAREVKEIKWKVSSQCCGRLIVQFKSFRVYDYLKLFSVRRKINEKLKLVVLPELYEMNPMGILEDKDGIGDSDMYSKTKSGDDPSEIFDIRQYRQGDKLHRVHWKLSSKKGELMVKEFSLPVSCAIVIMIEFYYKGGSKQAILYLNAIIETALSLSFNLLSQGNVHYVGFYDIRTKEYKRNKIVEEEDIFDTMEELLNLPVYNTELPVIPFQMEMFNNEQYTHMFYVGTNVNNNAITELQLHRPETKLKVFCLEEAEKKKNEKAGNIYGVDIHHVKENMETMLLD